jgi:hypothetical protein
MLVPTRDHAIAEQSNNYCYSTNHQVVINTAAEFANCAGAVVSNCVTNAPWTSTSACAPVRLTPVWSHPWML